MIPKTLRRDQWEKKLRALGLKPHDGLGKINTAEFWSDGTGYPISIPVDEHGDVDFWAFQRLCKVLGDKIWENWTGDDC